jgi:endonuclease/exonuclease/phosphatase family metal-dependent hydrolase
MIIRTRLLMNELTVMTLNVRHARGPRRGPPPWNEDAFLRTTGEVADVLRSRDPDVVALQEADRHSVFTGRFNHLARIAGEGGFGRAAHGTHFSIRYRRFGLYYGTSILSKLPLSDVRSRRFRARPLDTKGFVVAAVPLNGVMVDVASVHLDFLTPFHGPQVRVLLSELGERGRPLVLMGDLNTTGRRGRSAVRVLMRELMLQGPDNPAELPTYPAHRPSRKLDWILISPGLELARYEVVPDVISDHLAVQATIRMTGITIGTP